MFEWQEQYLTRTRTSQCYERDPSEMNIFVISLGAGEIFANYVIFIDNFLISLPPKKHFLPLWKMQIFTSRGAGLEGSLAKYFGSAERNDEVENGQ